MNLTSRAGLCRRLRRGPEARARLVESHLNKELAFQLRSLRDNAELSQEELAARVGMPQNAISRLENPNYGRATLTTLKRLAATYDVGLVVRFVPFSTLVNWVSGTPYLETGLSPESMDVPSFEEEDRRGALEIAPTAVMTTLEIPSPALAFGWSAFNPRVQFNQAEPFAFGAPVRLFGNYIGQAPSAIINNQIVTEPVAKPKQEWSLQYQDVHVDWPVAGTPHGAAFRALPVNPHLAERHHA